MSDLGPLAKSLVAGARGAHELSDERRANLRRSVLSATAASGVALSGAMGHAASAAKASGAPLAASGKMGVALVAKSLTVKMLALLGLGLVVATGGAYLGKRADERHRESDSLRAGSTEIAPSLPASTDAPARLEPLPLRAAPISSTDLPLAEATQRAPEPRVRATHGEKAKSNTDPVGALESGEAKPSSALLQEASELTNASNAVRAGAYDQALSLLDRHALSYPSSVLAPERALLRVRALCGAGRVAEARAASSALSVQARTGTCAE